MKQQNNKLVTYDYEGASISFQNGENVMVNATEMAKVFNKRAVDWTRTQSAQDYLTALSKVQKCTLTDLVIVTRGDSASTWMHRNAALEFARWLSPEFGIWCNDRILELMQNGHVELPHRKPALSKTRVEAFFAVIEGVDKVFSLDAVSKQRMYNKFATDNDLPLLDYVASEKGNRDSLTNLLKKYGSSLTTRQANKRLEEAGILELRTRTKGNGKVAKFYVVTEKGKTYGDNFQSEHSPKQTQPLWYENQFTNLLNLM